MTKSGKSSQARPSNESDTPTKASKSASRVKKAQIAQPTAPPEWLDNPEYMVFTRMPTVVPSYVPLESLGVSEDESLVPPEVRRALLSRALLQQNLLQQNLLQQFFQRDDDEQGAPGLFGRARDAVKADFERVIAQLQFVLDGMSQVTKNYDLDEITFELGFTAQGKVVFIAEASVAATVTATFKRRQAASGG
jgi:hypothetical protein